MKNFETVQNLRKQFAEIYYELNIRKLEFDYLNDRLARNELADAEQVKLKKVKSEIEKLEKEVTPIHDAIMKLTIPYRIEYSEEITERGMPITQKRTDILWLVTDIQTNEPIDVKMTNIFENKLLENACLEVFMNIRERKGTCITLHQIQKHL